MSLDPSNPQMPEHVAAYVDGELAREQQSAMAAWLIDHPEAAAEVAVWRNLDALMQASRAPEPAVEKWTETRRQIETALAASRTRPGQSLLRLALGLAAAAAAVLVFVFRPSGDMPTVPDEPLPVASAQDVVILSIAPGDIPALIVGAPPATDPMVLATPAEVTLVRAEPDAEGAAPNMWNEEGAAPMIVPPIGPDGR